MENVANPAELTAHRVMTSPVIACREESRLEEIAEVLGDHRVSGLAVVNADGVLVGMISERDIAHALGGPLLRLAVRRPGREGDADRRFFIEGAHLVRDVMSSPPVTAKPTSTLAALSQAMSEKQINRIPIVDEGRLVGMVTRGDVLKGIGGVHRNVAGIKDPVIVGSGIADSTVTRPRR
jgi:CBS domain-containing protein